MAQPPRTASHGTFFITAPTFNRRSLFQADANAHLVLDTLQHYRRAGHYLLHAFVVMPDHVHLLLTPQDITIERAMQYIKGGFSHRLGSNFPAWQKGYTDHRIRNSQEFFSRRDYIHNNPVRARLCQQPEDFLYSSAYRPAAEAAPRRWRPAWLSHAHNETENSANDETSSNSSSLSNSREAAAV